MPASRCRKACAARGIAFAVGGAGAWPEDPKGCARFSDFASFHQFLGTLKPPPF